MRRLACGVALALVALTAGPAAAATSSDQQLAKAGVLQLSDFPSGWKQGARSPASDAQVDAQAAKIASCRPFRAFTAENRKHPRAKSPDFDFGQASVTNTVSVFPSTAKAVAAMTTFRDDKLPTCLRELFNAVFTKQLHKDKTVAKQLASITTDVGLAKDVSIGDDAVVYQGTVDVKLKDGTTQTVGLGFLTVRVGTALSGYSYTSDTDISAALQPAIVTSVSRLQRAAPA
jgi:hypothetical protein